MTGAERAKLSRLRKKKRRGKLSREEQRELDALEGGSRQTAEDAEPLLQPQTVAETPPPAASTWAPGSPEPSSEAGPQPTDGALEPEQASSSAPPAPPPALEAEPEADPNAQPTEAQLEARAQGAQYIATLYAGIVGYAMGRAVQLLDRSLVPEPLVPIFEPLRDEPVRRGVLATVRGAASSCASRFGGPVLEHMDVAIVVSSGVLSAAVIYRAQDLPDEQPRASGLSPGAVAGGAAAA